MAEKKDVAIFNIGEVADAKISISSNEVEIIELKTINEAVFDKKFS